MSINDFDQSSPDEFQAIYQSWEKNHMQQEWERVRFLACSVLQPYSKNTLKVTDVCRFSWEDKKEIIQVESTRERFEQLKKKAHLL